MPTSLPPLNALRAFEAASRHLSFSKAANELFVTPGAVSRHIKGLEDYLGVKLFRRSAKGLELTDAAISGQEALGHGFKLLESAVEQIRHERQDHETSLTVAMTPSFAAKWFMPRLPHFTSAHPDIDLRISANTNQIDRGADVAAVCKHSLDNNRLGLSIRFGRGVYPGCVSQKMLSVNAVPLCSPTLLQGKHPLRNPRDLVHHTLLHDDTQYEGHWGWAQWLRAAGFNQVNASHGIHFNHVSLALASAADGQGVVLSLDVLAQRDIDNGSLIVPFGPAIPLDFAYYLVMPEHLVKHESVQRLRDWLMGEVQLNAEAA